jgi:hypothetical protein
MSVETKLLRSAALGAVLCLSIAPGVSWAGPDEWAARVDRIEGALNDQDAEVQHGGSSQPARPYLHLYRGDEVEVHRNGVTVFLSLPGGDTKAVTSRNSPFTISTESSGPMLAKSMDYLSQGLGNWLSGGGVAVPHSTYTRGGAAPQVPPSEDDVEPAGVQYLPDNYSSAAFVWRGQGGVLQIQQDGAGAPYAHDTRVTSILVSIPATGDVTAQLQGATFSWQLRRASADQVPAPPWYPAGFKPTSNQERVLRAMWLVQSGPKEWRTFALSELAVLSATEEDANEAWSAIRTGDTPEAP